jgi:hypothetical protein
MSGDNPSNIPKGQGPNRKPQPAADQPQPKRRPAKTRQLAWAKIDGGKGTWKPK